MELQQIVAETRLGIVPFRGRFSVSDRPLLVVIAGTFDNWRSFERVPGALPGVDVALASVPGFGCPELREVGIPAYIDAMREALAICFPGRSPVVAGSSLGGVVALGLQARRTLAFEPFLSSPWPETFIEHARAQMVKQRQPGLARLLEAVFGVTAASVAPRDYRPLLADLAGEVTAYASDVTEAELPRLPSFLKPDDLSLLERHPRVTVKHVPNAAHDLFGEAGAYWLHEVRQALRDPLESVVGGHGVDGARTHV